ADLRGFTLEVWLLAFTNSIFCGGPSRLSCGPQISQWRWLACGSSPFRLCRPFPNGAFRSSCGALRSQLTCSRPYHSGGVKISSLLACCLLMFRGSSDAEGWLRLPRLELYLGRSALLTPRAANLNSTYSNAQSDPY